MVANAPTRPCQEQSNVLYSADQKDMDKIAFKCIRSHLKPLEYLTHA